LINNKKEINNMRFTTQEYIALKSETLPYKTKCGTIIDQVEGYCPDCNKKLTDIKMQIDEYSGLVVIWAAGVCHDCKLIVNVDPVKITQDDDYYVLRDNQWMQIQKPNWYSKIKNWLK